MALGRRLAPLFSTRGGKLRLFLASLGVLAVGLLLAPRAPTRVTQAPPNLPVPRLQTEIERRDPAHFFARVPAVADAVAAHVVAFHAPPPPAPVAVVDHTPAPGDPEPLGYGLVVSADGDVLTHVSALAGALAPRVEGGAATSLTGRVTAMDPQTGLALVRLDAAASLPLPAVSASAPAPGDLLVGVGRHGARPATRLALMGAAIDGDYGVTPLGAGLAPGMPLFSAEREAVAVTGRDGRRAFAVPYALERLGRLVADGTAMPVTLGLAMQPLTVSLAAAFGAGGVLVSAVRAGGPAERAGVRHGDVVVAVGGAAVSDVEAARVVIARLPPQETVELVLRRDGKDLVVELQPEPTLRLGASLALEPVPDGQPLAGALFEAGELEQAGVSPAARVLEIGGRAVTQRTAAAQLRRARAPRVVYLDDGGQRFFAAIGAGS
jgi:S1-C subfamily serine protease